MNTKLAELEDFYKNGGGSTDRKLLNTKTLTVTSDTAPALSQQDIEEVKKSVILTGIKKDIVLGTIRYYSQCNALFTEFRLHPETEKMMEKIAYGAEYGLPVEKELLFKALPELFGSEIRHLSDEAQHKYLKPQATLGYVNNPQLADQKKHLLGRPLTNDQKLYQKIKLMKLYHIDQARDFAEYYLPYLVERANTFGYQDENSYLEDLLVIDDAKLTDVEKRIVAEVHSLQKIEEDIAALQIRRSEMPPVDVDALPFPILDPAFREDYIRRIKYMCKFEIHHDFAEVFFA